MKKILIILVILASVNNARGQDYFFEFVDGWVNNYCLEFNESYHYLGLNIITAPFDHEYNSVELNSFGQSQGGGSFYMNFQSQRPLDLKLLQ